SVPAYYREVYEAIRCRTDERVQVEVFERLLQRAGLSKTALSQPAQNDVLTISETLEKLLAKDTVQVELIPEKKGLFLKHVEYQVTSQARILKEKSATCSH
ncbi:hypothetical protein GOODEAATRI_021694, partial [Goodea atripinnis]